MRLGGITEATLDSLIRNFQNAIAIAGFGNISMWEQVRVSGSTTVREAAEGMVVGSPTSSHIAPKPVILADLGDQNL
jgi:hypothetical protein